MKNNMKIVLSLLSFVAIFSAHNLFACADNITPPCTISNFSANSTSISSGNSVTLNWNTNNCTSLNILQVGSVGSSGSTILWPTTTTTYTLQASGTTGQTQSKSLTVNVSNPIIMTGNMSTGLTSCIISRGNNTCSIPFSWSTQNPEANSTITHDNVIVANGNSSSQTFDIFYGVQTYYLYNNNKLLDSRTVQAICSSDSSWNGSYCEFANNSLNNCSISSFTASDTSIENGDYTTLRWNTNNCDRVKISNIGYVTEDGSEMIYPTEDITYTLMAYNTDGSHETDTVRIYVNDSSNNYTNCAINRFTASDTSINMGDSVVLRWNTSDCDNADISNIGSVSTDGSVTIYPYNSTTYTLRANGENNSKSKSIRINVGNSQDIVYQPIYNNNVVTIVATNISQNSAQLNGLITNADYNNSTTYFDYGTTVNFGSRTPSRVAGSNTNFSGYITNLSPNTIYFFQAVSEGPNGISRGAVEVFETLGYQVVTSSTNTSTSNIKIIKQVTEGKTVVNSASPIMLKIENRYQTIGQGDIVDYTVTYKNISNDKLTNPMIQVYVPKGMTVLNSSDGTYSESNMTLSVPIKDLNPGAEGTVYLQARVDSIDPKLAQIVTTAILIYTNPSGAQENAMAYALNTPKVTSNNNLGAAVIFGKFINFNLIGWLIVIVLILLLVLLIRRFYGHANVKHNP